MDDNLKEKVKLLGLTEGEAKVYLSLLELGSSTIGPIIKKANIASSNVYDILNRLLKKGIVSYILKQKIKYFQESSKAEVFIGKKGLKAAYKKHLQKNSENLFFYIHKKRYEKESDLFYFSIIDLYGSIPTKGIVNEYSKSSPWFKKVKNSKIKFTNSPIPGNIEVCNDSILMIAWDKTITTILIKSIDIANNLRKYFNDMWNSV